MNASKASPMKISPVWGTSSDMARRSADYLRLLLAITTPMAPASATRAQVPGSGICVGGAPAKAGIGDNAASAAAVLDRVRRLFMGCSR